MSKDPARPAGAARAAAENDEPMPGHGHSDEKARQILDGAREVFLRDGFDGASMNGVARAAGVSKGTLYAYFQSKDELFAGLIRHDKRQQAERVCRWGRGEAGRSPREALLEVGRAIVTMLIRPDHLAQLRTVMAVAPKFPSVGRAFYEAGPLYGIERLAALLDGFVAEGTHVIADTRLASIQFLQLCQGDFFRRAMFCVGETPSPQEVEAGILAAVDVFERAYARR